MPFDLSKANAEESSPDCPFRTNVRPLISTSPQSVNVKFASGLNDTWAASISLDGPMNDILETFTRRSGRSNECVPAKKIREVLSIMLLFAAKPARVTQGWRESQFMLSDGLT